MIGLARAMLRKDIQCIPVNGNKNPIVEFKDIEITGEFIEKHRQLYQQATALGVLCRGVWCIDIDIGGDKDGIKSLKENMYFKEIDENARQTLLQKTPSGGLHLVFKKRDGIEYGQKINYLKDVDIKAHPNNYFLLSGSVTLNGKYEHIGGKAKHYDGEFEKRIFSSRGSFEQQTMDKHSMRAVLPEYDFSHISDGRGGEGKAAYQRIVDGTTMYRNDDFFKAVSYALQCGIDLEPLKILIGDVKAGDLFTESEWQATFESARLNSLNSIHD